MEKLKNPNVLVAIIIAAVVVIGCIAWFTWQGSQTATVDNTLVARVHDGDGGTTELPLSQDGTRTITTKLGTNVIEVADGAVHVDSATCSNKDCMRQGAISQQRQQIICLPNKLWIEIVHEGDADGKMDAAKTPDNAGSADNDSGSAGNASGSGFASDLDTKTR